MMVALVIFSFMIGISSQFISLAMKGPFTSERVEPWLSFIERANQSLLALPDGHELLGNGVHQDPFQKLEKPRSLDMWRMEWVDNNMVGYKSAAFTAKTKQNRKIEWVIHRKQP